MENTRYEDASETGLAFQADVDLLRLGFRITDKEQREEAFNIHCEFLSKYDIKTEDKGEKRK